MSGLSPGSKWRRFEELRASPYCDAVLAANRAYLAVAVPDAPAGAGQRWVLTCLPTTKMARGRRLSAVSMRNMETFVLRVDERTGRPPHGLAVVRRSTVLRGFASRHELMRTFDLHDVYESGYQAAGPDQLALAGAAEALVNALDNPHVAAGARDLAQFLTTSNTVYARFHNSYLTDAVLDVTPDT